MQSTTQHPLTCINIIARIAPYLAHNIAALTNTLARVNSSCYEAVTEYGHTSFQIMIVQCVRQFEPIKSSRRRIVILPGQESQPWIFCNFFEAFRHGALWAVKMCLDLGFDPANTDRCFLSNLCTVNQPELIRYVIRRLNIDPTKYPTEVSALSTGRLPIHAAARCNLVGVIKMLLSFVGGTSTTTTTDYCSRPNDDDDDDDDGNDDRKTEQGENYKRRKIVDHVNVSMRSCGSTPLLLAAKSKASDAAEFLIEQGAVVGFLDDIYLQKRTNLPKLGERHPFFTAVLFNNISLVRFLLDKRLVDVNVADPETKLTALHFACMMVDDPDMVTLLLERGADVNALAKQQMPTQPAPSLQPWAASDVPTLGSTSWASHLPDSVRFSRSRTVVSLKQSIRPQNPILMSPLCYAVGGKELSVDYTARDNCIFHNNSNASRLGARSHATTLPSVYERTSFFTPSVENGLSSYGKRQRAIINILCKHHCHHHHRQQQLRAAAATTTNTASSEKGGGGDMPTIIHIPPLIRAILNIGKGRISTEAVFDMLLHHHKDGTSCCFFDVNETPRKLDMAGRTALHTSIQEFFGAGHPARKNIFGIIRFLVERRGANVNALDSDGRTPLRLAIDINKSHEEGIPLMEFLLKRGADPGRADVFGQNCLMAAAVHDRSTNWNVGRLLLLGSPNNDNDDDAEEQSDNNNGGDKTTATTTSTKTSKQGLHGRHRRRLRRNFLPVYAHERDSKGNNAGHYASDNNNLPCVQFLVEEAQLLDVNCANYGGETMLHFAASRCNSELCTWLVGVPGINTQLKTVHGSAALDFAGLNPSRNLHDRNARMAEIEQLLRRERKRVS